MGCRHVHFRLQFFCFLFFKLMQPKWLTGCKKNTHTPFIRQLVHWRSPLRLTFRFCATQWKKRKTWKHPLAPRKARMDRRTRRMPRAKSVHRVKVTQKPWPLCPWDPFRPLAYPCFLSGCCDRYGYLLSSCYGCYCVFFLTVLIFATDIPYSLWDIFSFFLSFVFCFVCFLALVFVLFVFALFVFCFCLFHPIQPADKTAWECSCWGWGGVLSV